MLAVRKQHPVLAIGQFEMLHAQNPSVLAYLRRGVGDDGEEDIVLCVNNLSRFPQPCELMLEQLAGKVPIELTGRVPFPPIGELPYFVTLAGHGFYWFELVDQQHDVWTRAFGLARRRRTPAATAILSSVTSIRAASASVVGRGRLPRRPCRRWPARAREALARLGGSCPGSGGTPATSRPPTWRSPPSTPRGRPRAGLAPGRRHRRRRAPRHLPGRAGRRPAPAPDFLQGKARVTLGEVDGWIYYDALVDPDLALVVLELVAPDESAEAARPLVVEQSNTSVVYDERLILKLFRRVYPEPNPDVEVTKALGELGFPHVVPQLAELRYERPTWRSSASTCWDPPTPGTWRTPRCATCSTSPLPPDEAGGDFGPEA